MLDMVMNMPMIQSCEKLFYLSKACLNPVKICEETVSETSSRLKAVNYVRNKFHLRYWQVLKYASDFYYTQTVKWLPNVE